MLSSSYNLLAVKTAIVLQALDDRLNDKLDGKPNGWLNGKDGGAGHLAYYRDCESKGRGREDGHGGEPWRCARASGAVRAAD
jgi:hypothetical protein